MIFGFFFPNGTIDQTAHVYVHGYNREITRLVSSKVPTIICDLSIHYNAVLIKWLHGQFSFIGMREERQSIERR